MFPYDTLITPTSFTKSMSLEERFELYLQAIRNYFDEKLNENSKLEAYLLQNFKTANPFSGNEENLKMQPSEFLLKSIEGKLKNQKITYQNEIAVLNQRIFDKLSKIENIDQCELEWIQRLMTGELPFSSSEDQLKISSPKMTTQSNFMSKYYPIYVAVEGAKQFGLNHGMSLDTEKSMCGVEGVRIVLDEERYKKFIQLKTIAGRNTGEEGEIEIRQRRQIKEYHSEIAKTFKEYF